MTQKGRIISVARRTALALLACLLVVPLAHATQRIFINGTEVTSHVIRDRSFTQVDEIRFDSDGNMHIIAPIYELEVSDRQEGPPRNADAMSLIIQTRYIVTFVNQNPGTVPYDVTLQINGRTVTTFPSTRGNAAEDITGYLKLGENRVVLIAQRTPVQRTGRPTEQLRVVVGPGTYDGYQATVRTAAAGIDVPGTETRQTFRTEAVFHLAPAARQTTSSPAGPAPR